MRSIYILTIILIFSYIYNPLFSKENISKVKSSGNVTHSLNVLTKYGTQNFELHTNRSNLKFSERIIEILENDSKKLFEYFKYVSKETIHIAVEDDAVSANGTASVFPRNLISLNNYPPIGEHYLVNDDDWIKTLIIHELTHIIHMDQTRGILKVVRAILGATSKWGGIVPTWFLEGIAVWSETKFTKGGRLKSKLLEYEVNYLLSDGEFCRSIDCLDDPGRYPYGSTPYWLGAYFIDWLESRKTGTVSCLVRENSDSLPFFLSSAFKECTNLKIKKAFQIFRESKIIELGKKKLLLKENDFVKLLTPINLIGSIDRGRALKEEKINLDQSKVLMRSNIKLHIAWQRGSVISNDSFVSVLQDGTKQKFYRYNFLKQMDGLYPLSDSVDSIMPPTSFSKERGEFLYVLDRWTGYKLEKIWKKFSLLTFKGSETLDFDDEYLFQIDELSYLGLQFSKNRWKIVKHIGNKREILYSFRDFLEITKPTLQIFKNKLLITVKTYYPEKFGEFEYGLKIIQLDREKNEISDFDYKLEDPFSYIGSCQNFKLIKTYQNKITLFELTDNTLERVTNYLIDKSWIKNLATIKMDKKNVLLFFEDDPDLLYKYKGECKNFIDYLLVNFVDKQLLEKVETTKENTFENKAKKEWESYPSFRHFIPNYWAFLYNSGYSLDSWSVFTSFYDPKKNHTVKAVAKRYPKISKNGFNLSYTLALGDGYFGLKYDKEYSWSKVRRRSNLNTVKTVNIYNYFNLSKFLYVPYLQYSLITEEDFISERDSIRYTFLQSYSYIPPFRESFFQNISLLVDLYQQKKENSKSFIGMKSKFSFPLSFHDRIKFSINSTYGRLYKEGFSDGVIYGGGGSTEGQNIFHEFYGLSYNDAYGNEILTARAELDLNLWKMYFGPGIFPLYFRELHGVFGRNYLKSERVYFKRSLRREEYLESYHFGFKLSTKIFYWIPLDIQFLRVMIEDKNGVSEDSYLTLLKGSVLEF